VQGRPVAGGKGGKRPPRFWLAGEPLRARVKVCIEFGMGTGFVLSVFALLIVLLGGTSTTGGIAVWVILPAYPILGGLAGSVVGALLPFARSSLGAVVVGIIAALLPVAAITSMLYGFQLDRRFVVVVLATSAMVGGGSGYVWRTLRIGPLRE
jgi:hypothetical protein